MWTGQLRLTRPLVPIVLVGLTLTAACEAKPSLGPSSTATPYRVSGVARDAVTAAPIPNATITLRHNRGTATTKTDADGAYAFSFDTHTPFERASDALGLLISDDGSRWGDASGHWVMLQLLPLGSADLTHDVRFRPVQVLEPGASLHLAIEPDSSLEWDLDWDPGVFVAFDWLWEHFLVPVKSDGVLTIETHPGSGGLEATIFCRYVGCPSWHVLSAVSIPVEANRSYFFSVRVPRGSAPQRYLIQTTLR